LVNTDDLEDAVYAAERRVLEIQSKLHCWARDDLDRRFDDLFNLVHDPGFLLVAWDRVRGNKGANTPGVDGRTAAGISLWVGAEEFLEQVRSRIKDRTFRPQPARERMIPKPGGKKRRLGISTIEDRVVQASLKLVLEPIFEADFLPCSYGFRPNRRAHDAVAEVRFFASKKYEWIVEGDIKACFDEISHPALMGRLRARIGDKRVLALLTAFLKAGILTEDEGLRETSAGTPQGSILSPLLSNVALSVLDEFVAQAPGGPGDSVSKRHWRRVKGLANIRLVRYADDWCLMVHGTREDAVALRDQISGVLSTMGLSLSPEKTLITHIDEGLDFLGWHIQRHLKKGTSQVYYVYTYPSRKSLANVMGKVKTLCRTMDTNQPLDALLARLNPSLRGWCAYFRPGVSSAAFGFLAHYARDVVIRWLRRKHRRTNWGALLRRYCDQAGWPRGQDAGMFNPEKVGTTRYRYRGAAIPSPWPLAAISTSVA
jgi:RNA-directed DNA polymerase